MFARLKKRLKRLVTPFTKLADFRIFESLDGVGSFHKDEIYRLPWIDLKRICVSPSGRFVFVLLRGQTEIVDSDENFAMIPGGLTTLVMLIIDTHLASRYTVEVQDLWQMRLSYVVVFYALEDKRVVIIDQNIIDNTLRQRIVSIEHVRRKSFCFGHRGFRFSNTESCSVGAANCVVLGFAENSSMLMFAKDPSKPRKQEDHFSVNVTSLVRKLDEFVASKGMSERIFDSSKFLSFDDAQLCFFIFSNNGRLAITEEGKIKCAGISLSDETMTIHELEVCSKAKRSLDDENAIFFIIQRASSSVICSSISIDFPTPSWLMLLVMGSRVLTWFCFFKYIYKPYVWGMRCPLSTSLLLSVPVTLLISLCFSHIHSIFEFGIFFPKIMTRTSVIDTKNWRQISVLDEQSGQYSLVAEDSNEIISVAAGQNFLSIRAVSNPIGNYGSLTSLLERFIKIFPNKLMKSDARTLPYFM